jgi:hypothetical protein
VELGLDDGLYWYFLFSCIFHIALHWITSSMNRDWFSFIYFSYFSISLYNFRNKVLYILC